MKTLYEMVFLTIEKDIALHSFKNWLLEDTVTQAYAHTDLYQQLALFDYDQENAHLLFSYFLYAMNLEIYCFFLIHKYCEQLINEQDIENSLFKLNRFNTLSNDIAKLTAYRKKLNAKPYKRLISKKKLVAQLKEEAQNILNCLQFPVLTDEVTI